MSACENHCSGGFCSKLFGDYLVVIPSTIIIVGMTLTLAKALMAGAPFCTYLFALLGVPGFVGAGFWITHAVSKVEPY